MSQVKGLPWTADELMSRNVEAIGAGMSLRDAATRLSRSGIHGAPVVDQTGRCVGVFSVSDLARWVSDREKRAAPLAQACAYQEKAREPGGREITLCRLAEGICPLQHPREMPDGRVCLVCSETHCVPTDWQMVELESLPTDAVRDSMTTTVISAEFGTPVPELARQMLDHGIHRLIVLDSEGHPVGVVTTNDLLHVLARFNHPPADVP